MSKSNRLRLRDVRSIFRLIGECRELGADSHAWRLHLFEGLVRLTGAQVGAGGDIQLTPTGPQPLHVADVGWSGEKERARFLQYQSENKLATDKLFKKFIVPLLQTGRVTSSRDQLIPSTEWYRSAHFNEYMRISGINESLISLHAVPHVASGTVSAITLYRACGERAFDDRTVRLVDLLHQELSPFIGRQLASACEPSAASLAPRVRETLHCLLDGDSAKQTASRLQISQETVNQYVKTIYRHFGVNSRGELLAFWMRKRR